MMTEVWLQTNRRALTMGLVPTLVLAGVGAVVLGVSEATGLTVLGWVLIASGVLLTLGIVRQFRQPRIAYRDDNVLFYLRAGQPVAVPREVVEAFFLGQGPSYLPEMRGRRLETVNLVARLSQKAPEWMHVSVKPALGHWCDGYVTIRGTWCEPLTGDVIRRLNARLRELRTAAADSPSHAAAIVDEGTP
jgi:hypothetical protein